MEALWFALAAVGVTAYVVTDGFDLGAGILHLFVAKDPRERAQVVAAVGPYWDGNEVWLLASGGTLVMAFPRLYASAFSGFYLPLMIVLWLLIGRACAVELRHQFAGRPWTAFWDRVFAVSSLLLVVGFGAALGNVVRGVPLDEKGEFFEPLWTDFGITGRTGILDVYTLLTALVAVVAIAHHGALWLTFKVDGVVHDRARRAAAWTWWGTVLGAIAVTAATFAVRPHVLERLEESPAGLAFPALAVAGLVLSRVLARRGQDGRAFLASGVFLAGMLGSAAFGLWPYVLPSNGDPALGMTAAAAAASDHALAIGLAWWLPGVAIAIGWQVYAYRRFAGKVASGDASGHDDGY